MRTVELSLLTLAVLLAAVVLGGIIFAFVEGVLRLVAEGL